MLLDTIISLSTDFAIPVTRQVASTNVNGLAVAGAITTFTIAGCVQPATGLARVVGGRDLLDEHDNQHVNDVRVVYTTTELFTRSATNEPDIVTYRGDPWIVFRVEEWNNQGQIWFRCAISRNVGGAS